MAKTKQQPEKNTNALRLAVDELRKEIHMMAQENAKRQLKATSLLRTKKDELARVLTTLSMMRFIQKKSVESGKEEVK